MKKHCLLLSVIVCLLFSFGCDGTTSGSGFDGTGKNCQILTQTVNFGEVTVGSSSRESASIQCMGITTLNVTVVSATNSFSINPNHATIQTTSPAEAVLVDTFFSPTVAGSINGAIRFQESNGDIYDILLVGKGTGTSSGGSELLPSVALSNNFPNGTPAYISLSNIKPTTNSIALAIGTDENTSTVLYTSYFKNDIQIPVLYMFESLYIDSNGVSIDRTLSYNLYVKACNSVNTCETEILPLTFE